MDRTSTTARLTRRAALALGLGGAALAIAPSACAPPTGPVADGAAAPKIPETALRAEPAPTAIKLIPAGYPFVQPGRFTVATTAALLPLSEYAPDGETLRGSEPDFARLIADSLGLTLDLQAVAWADWPLGLASGKYDAVISNVTVTEERKAKFDFSTYREDLLGIYARAQSTLGPITKPSDVAGLIVSVSASTNQAQILDRWNAQNIAAGLKPVEIRNYDDSAVGRLALLSGQVDVSFEPNATAAFRANDDKIKRLGTFSGGWPLAAQIAVATRKSSGLAPAVTEALNVQIARGVYAQVLERWNLQSEAVTEAKTNPPGLPA